MSEYRTDEETVEQLTRWWREHGTFLVVTLVVVVGGVVGWRWWQDTTREQAQAVSALYQEWTEARAAGDEARGEALAQRLRSEHAGSSYLALLALEEASRALENGDPAAARGALERVLELGTGAAFDDLARLRLARLDLEAGDAEAALGRLAMVRAGEDIGPVEELRGDALRVLGRLDEARAAYARALATGTATRGIVEMKLDELLAAAEGEG